MTSARRIRRTSLPTPACRVSGWIGAARQAGRAGRATCCRAGLSTLGAGLARRCCSLRDGLRQPRRVQRLDQVVNGAGLEGLQRMVTKGGDEDHMAAPGDLLRHLDARHAGHADVQEADLGFVQSSHWSQASAPCSAWATKRAFRPSGGQGLGQLLAGGDFVVGDQDAGHAMSLRVKRKSMRARDAAARGGACQAEVGAGRRSGGSRRWRRLASPTLGSVRAVGARPWPSSSTRSHQPPVGFDCRSGHGSRRPPPIFGSSPCSMAFSTRVSSRPGGSACCGEQRGEWRSTA